MASTIFFYKKTNFPWGSDKISVTIGEGFKHKIMKNEHAIFEKSHSQI